MSAALKSTTAVAHALRLTAWRIAMQCCAAISQTLTLIDRLQCRVHMGLQQVIFNLLSMFIKLRWATKFREQGHRPPFLDTSTVLSPENHATISQPP